MPSLSTCRPVSSIYQRCLIAKSAGAVRFMSCTSSLLDEKPRLDGKDGNGTQEPSKREAGAMSRKLEEATDDALLSGKAGRRAVEEAGFSSELKESLLQRIAQAGVQTAQQDSLSKQAGVGEAWIGSEAPADTVLRMLDDASKPMRVKFRPPTLKRSSGSPSQKAAAARDKASMYAHMGLKDNGLSAAEKEDLKREFRERFEPSGRAVPATISGLAALANERIEDAIARGQFKNLPRGRPVEADPLASNPFVDTTEYLMNRIIQRQEIVPPWIEKQQELGKAVDAFRVKLRADWKRHAARMIAAQGGTLEEQIRRAEDYAAAEREGSAEGFRDEAWERAERGYLKLAVEGLNRIARSYNLMAPELAKKPYHSLERELAACYADVAPFVAAEIRQRAVRPASARTPLEGRREGRVLGALGGEGVRVYERDAKPYGFKEWWRDVWRRK